MKNKSLEALNCYKIIRMICFVLGYSSAIKGITLIIKGDNRWVFDRNDFGLSFSIASVVIGIALIYGLHAKRPWVITWSLASLGGFYCVLAILNAVAVGNAPTGLFSISIICIIIAAYFKNEKVSEESP